MEQIIKFYQQHHARNLSVHVREKIHLSKNAKTQTQKNIFSNLWREYIE